MIRHNNPPLSVTHPGPLFPRKRNVSEGTRFLGIYFPLLQGKSGGTRG
jgi:hypothetical protein